MIYGGFKEGTLCWVSSFLFRIYLEKFKFI